MSYYFPTEDEIKTVFPALAEAAQREYDAWQQDENGFDEELGSGGICHLIADKMVEILQRVGQAAGGPVVMTKSLTTEQHVNVLILGADGIYEVDVPWSRYESGGGFTWTKKPDVSLTSEDVTIFKLDSDLHNYTMYLEDDTADEDITDAIDDFQENGNHIVQGIDLCDVRNFLETKWQEWQERNGKPQTGSASMCKLSSVCLQEILGEDNWAVVGGYADPTEHDPDVIYQKPGGYWDGKEYQSHQWIENGDILIDLTADQFGDKPIIVQCRSTKTHVINCIPEADELKENCPSALQWAEDWKIEYPDVDNIPLPDMISEHMNGLCYALAIQMHENTGLPIYVLSDEDGIPHHACVKIDDGYYLDARGEIPKNILGQWNGRSCQGKNLGPISVDDLKEFCMQIGFPEPDDYTRNFIEKMPDLKAACQSTRKPQITSHSPGPGLN